jgi:flagellar biogenesis protein FliO
MAKRDTAGTTNMVVSMRRWAALGSWWLLAGAAWAQTKPNAPLPAYQPPARGVAGESPAWLLLRAVLSLAVVIALVYAVAWLVKAKGALNLAPTGYRVRVLETVALGGTRMLHLVSVGDQVLLLGAGPEGVSHLASFSPAEVGYDPSALPRADSFLAKLQGFAKQEPVEADAGR